MGENIYLDTQRSQKSGYQDCFKGHVPLNYLRCGFRHSLGFN